MPIFARFGVLHLECLPCVLRMAPRLGKHDLVCLHGVAPHDIGTVNLPSTF